MFGVWSFFLMRITRGQAAWRQLKVPKGMGVRPTPGLVMQAVFNSLGARVTGGHVRSRMVQAGDQFEFIPTKV